MEIVELKIEMSGKAESNIALYQQSVLSQLEQIKSKKLITDEDFSTAEKVVKICKEQENALVDAKEKAQNKSATIKDVFEAIANAQNLFRDTRLELERQIKTEKVNRKQAIIDKAVSDFKTAESELLKRYDFKRIETSFNPTVEFLNATKGKKSIEKMQEAIDLVLGTAKEKLSNKAALKYSNIQTIKGRKDQFLFADVESLSDLAPDLLMKEIENREGNHKLEVERIQEEERLKEEKSLKKESDEKLAEETPAKDLEEEPVKEEPVTHSKEADQQQEIPETGGFPKPEEQQDKFNNSLPQPNRVKFRIEINSSWTMDEAKAIAGGLREKFGDCVTLSKL